MRFVAVSDLHGDLPRIEPCDILLVAGDVCPDYGNWHHQLAWLDDDFRAWLERVPTKWIVGIAGNHDIVFERESGGVADLHLPWNYLQDSGVLIENFRIYGTPWVPDLPGWAFSASDEELTRRFEAVPIATDILLAHTPPHGVPERGYHHIGARSALAAIERVQPRAYVCGHIHEGYGTVQRNKTMICNASRCTLAYDPTNEPIAFELEEAP